MAAQGDSRDEAQFLSGPSMWATPDGTGGQKVPVVNLVWGTRHTKLTFGRFPHTHHGRVQAPRAALGALFHHETPIFPLLFG